MLAWFLITNDFPFETIILLLRLLYKQKIFFGYWIIQFPLSVFSPIVCLKLKVKLSVFIKLLIILSSIEAYKGLTIVNKKKIIEKVFFNIKEHLFCQRDLLY